MEREKAEKFMLGFSTDCNDFKVYRRLAYLLEEEYPNIDIERFVNDLEEHMTQMLEDVDKYLDEEEGYQEIIDNL